MLQHHSLSSSCLFKGACNWERSLDLLNSLEGSISNIFTPEITVKLFLLLLRRIGNKNNQKNALIMWVSFLPWPFLSTHSNWKVATRLYCNCVDWAVPYHSSFGHKSSITSRKPFVTYRTNKFWYTLYRCKDRITLYGKEYTNNANAALHSHDSVVPSIKRIHGTLQKLHILHVTVEA